MRFFARSLLCVGIAVAVAGCDPSVDKHYFKYGIGANLPPADLVETTNELEAYVDAICWQAGLAADKNGSCSAISRKDDAATWKLFVEAGMNDIDRRCDAYLVWLDNIRRGEGPALKQISDTHVATQLILTATSAGAVPMAIVATAFGLAADTLTNVNSRLILSVNHSTVQSVVLGKQRDFRKELLGDGKTKPSVVIDNRPAAIYALRNYMRLCMPMTIETEINNTIVAYQSGGIDAYKNNPMVSAGSISQPVKAEQKQFKPERPFTAAPKEIAAFFAEKLSNAETKEALSGLCYDPVTAKAVGNKTYIAALVKIFENAPNLDDDVYKGLVVRDDKINGYERRLIALQTDCGAAKNYYERHRYANTTSGQAMQISGAELADLPDLLNTSKNGGIVQSAPLKDLRVKIAAVRKDDAVNQMFKTKVTQKFVLEKGMQEQLTPDLLEALRELKAKQ